jgi:outer membrane receptor protein involved in Fe transport
MHDYLPGSSSAYSVVNAKLGYRINDMIKLNASINNLTNEKYYQFYLMPGINLTTDIMLSF